VLLMQYFIVCLQCDQGQLDICDHTDIQTNAASNAKFLVRASFLEIYNEKLSDLMVRSLRCTRMFADLQFFRIQPETILRSEMEVLVKHTLRGCLNAF